MSKEVNIMFDHCPHRQHFTQIPKVVHANSSLRLVIIF